MKPSEVREKKDSELNSKLQDFRKELFNLRFQHATGQLGNTQRMTTVKRNIARILTILRERKLEQSNE
jgi:large subunit ribosomal protein L29